MSQPDPALGLFPDAGAPACRSARRDHLTFKANRMHGRHGWLRLTPAYSLHLVDELVRTGGRGARVLDPFCGTGTTALVCAEAGIPCDTVDINPFLVWLANAKCARYSSDKIAVARGTLTRVIQARLTSSAIDGAWVPPIKDIAKWWDTETLALLASVFADLEAADVSIPAHDLLRVVFCRVAIESAAVSFGHQSMSFKKQAMVTPALFTSSASERLMQRFIRAGDDVFRAARSPVEADCGRAHPGDSRDLLHVLPRTDYTTVVTSPPYPNRMSYIRELRPYMYWLGYLETGRQAGELDWQAIGGTWGIATSYLLSWVPKGLYKMPDPTFEETIERINDRSKILGTYVTKYFQDIVPHIRSLKSILAPYATVHYVVGNSKFYDVMLHTEQAYAAIFRAEGFHDVRITNIRKRTSKRELFEYVVSAYV